TPTYLHFEMAKEALLAGKHIVLEKPMTATSLEAEELIKIAENKNLVIAVYHSKRFEGGFKTVKKLITEKKIGEVTNCHISMHRYKPEIGPKVWKEGDFPGAGLLYDIGSHLIDQCLVLFGWPLEIDADLQIQRKEGQVIDYFFITLKYKHFNATITSDMFTKEEKPSFTIEGTKATFIKYGKDPQEARLIEGNINWEQLGDDDEEKYGILTHNNSNTHEHIPTEKGAYYDFYQNIHEVIRHNVPLLITPDQALNVIKMIEWVQKTAPTIIATRDN
ncbi:MAG: Gfo/Idh/MocA family oxidoreductase, partial [Cyclobacteriaceae bacterium]|nr:Gfo/Idh/MocA family oxidoreductase [Cyclobacteriaceae bacterium]